MPNGDDRRHRVDDENYWREKAVLAEEQAALLQKKLDDVNCRLGAEVTDKAGGILISDDMLEKMRRAKENVPIDNPPFLTIKLYFDGDIYRGEAWVDERRVGLADSSDFWTVWQMLEGLADHYYPGYEEGNE